MYHFGHFSSLCVFVREKKEEREKRNRLGKNKCCHDFGADTIVSIRYLLDNPAEFEVLEIMGDAADSFFDKYEI